MFLPPTLLLPFSLPLTVTFFQYKPQARLFLRVAVSPNSVWCCVCSTAASTQRMLESSPSPNCLLLLLYFRNMFFSSSSSYLLTPHSNLASLLVVCAAGQISSSHMCHVVVVQVTTAVDCSVLLRPEFFHLAPAKGRPSPTLFFVLFWRNLLLEKCKIAQEVRNGR